MQKQYRLNGERSFRIIYKYGAFVSCSAMRLIFLKSKQPDIKIGLTTSKHIGNSVTRNKVKRRLRECFRKLIPEMPMGYNYVLVARSSISELPFDKMLSELTILVNRVKNIEKNHK